MTFAEVLTQVRELLQSKGQVSYRALKLQFNLKEEAHRVLGEVSNWFTEGFDTKDLQEAKVLLDEIL
jgi:predicted ATPase